jgi:hypothetical protein
MGFASRSPFASPLVRYVFYLKSPPNILRKYPIPLILTRLVRILGIFVTDYQTYLTITPNTDDTTVNRKLVYVCSGMFRGQIFR